jgi:hypothetical protein
LPTGKKSTYVVLVILGEQSRVILRDNRKEGYRLIAGDRRLRAVRLLKWKTIPATLRDQLTEEQLRDIELEENDNRKALTAAERRKTFRVAKRMVEAAKKAAEVLGHRGQKPKTKGTAGGRPAKPDSPSAVAEALGVSRHTVERAEQQVDLGERFPWLQSDAWVQADVLKLRKYLTAIPDEEHVQLMQFMEEGARPLLPRPDGVLEYVEVMRLKTPEERAQIYLLW